MYNIGMYGGSFNPLHLGHVNDIIKAANQCEKLYIVLSNTNDPNEIDHRERLMWLKNITQDMENVEVFEIFDRNTSKDTYDWNLGAEDVKNYIGQPIDVVFAGDDYKGRNIWESLYPESEIVYFSREEINISSTMIRANPFEYYDYLPKIVQKHYVKKVCVVGTESCGKSTLVRNLAKYFNTTYVEEAGRYICEEAGGIDNMQKHHFFEILFKHKELEKAALENANKILLIDTDSLITLHYYQLNFNENTKRDKDFENIARSISNLNDYDLYLFLEPDVKFVDDITRGCGDDSVREENNEKLKKILDANHIKYVSIKGTYQDRYEESKRKVKQLIGR